ncbi:MAG: ABC transporter ATP-binding protein, partial [Deltaproteobacteria bacterium]|nr:ABC transporter ATP-binding protein [Deltaproteobacteria bacterium]
MNAIEINNLFKVFRGKKLARVEALKDLSLAIPKGEVFGFLGPNGAGKSTTIKTLMGLIRPTSGRVRLMGLDVTDARSRLLVGFLPENPAFYDFLSAREYLQFVGRTFKMEPALLKKRIEEVLERFDLVAAAKRPMRGYSKGMVQRLGLAQTLVHDPDLYILDEPMSGLDPLGRALVKDLIKELKQKGKTVFFSSHITS